MGALSLKNKLAMVIVSITLITILLGGAVYYSLNKSEADSDIVNTAGRQRMLSQAMAKSVLGYSLAKNSLQAAESQVSELNRYITNMRGTYAGVVIGPAKKQGMKISMHPENESDQALPFPATFARIVGEKFAEGGIFSVDIINDDPVNPKQGLKDTVDKEAFQALKANPKQQVFREIEQDGKLYLRFYTADNAVAPGCASCHTAIKGREFKVGDMLGIRRFSMLFAADAAVGRARLDPSLKEYETAAVIFRQTLAALKSGGEYPADLTMTTFKSFVGIEDPVVLDKITEIEVAFAEFNTSVSRLTNAEIGSDEYWQAQYDVPSSANNLRKLSDGLTRQFAAIAHVNQSNVRMNVSIMIAVVILAFIGLYLMISNGILEQIRRVTRVATTIAQGDLTQHIHNKRKDEIGELYSALNQMANNLNGMISRIASTSHSLVASSADISLATDKVTAGAEHQSQQTEIVAVSANEMEIVSKDISRNTTEAADAASQASKVALDGGEVVHRSIEGMEGIAASVSDSARSVEQLAQHSTQIDKIVSVIDDIANQTNLLALNAAIEAARAGEQGRGFAVVADEVRHLATRTTEATKEIADMIRNIQNGTEAAVQSMQEGRAKVENGSELAALAGQSLQKIVEVIDGLTDRIQQIATATQEQSVSMAEVTSNIGTVSQVAKTAQEQTHLSSQSCAKITRLADELQSMVGGFKL
ncbi:hypothetical protein MNBD_GAMMA26-329 [hydrothermal vent metagenome]|uniref:Methyl-accepting chemotaxis sensor/transducer protein n=1 Tax=hydrothermal vent metagenome TaxID=652676 RepID=A0A3B1B5R6_9ZZZZ